MKSEIDIHNYKRKLESALRSINKAQISAKNKKLILKFQDSCIADGLSKARIIRLLECLRHIALILKKDFDKAKKEDIQKTIGIIQQKDYSVWTKQIYKVVIKKFYKWLKGKDDYPEQVRWINTNIKKSDLKLPAEGDLLKEEEIKKLLQQTEHPRDKALISTLYESGCRIGEILSMKLNSINFDKYGAVIVVKGKTGSRKIRLVASTPYLATWIESHPSREKEAPLWINIGAKNHSKHMLYGAVRVLLKRLFKKAGIKKRFNPHIFRHSRATYLANHLTEFQMNQYFGWVQGSDMPAIYVHLSGRETDQTLLELNGIKTSKKKEKESLLKPKRCPRCDTINAHDSKFCNKCAAILDINVAIELEEKREQEQELRKTSDDVMNLLMKDKEFQEILLRKIRS